MQKTSKYEITNVISIIVTSSLVYGSSDEPPLPPLLRAAMMKVAMMTPHRDHNAFMSATTVGPWDNNTTLNNAHEVQILKFCFRGGSSKKGYHCNGTPSKWYRECLLGRTVCPLSSSRVRHWHNSSLWIILVGIMSSIYIILHGLSICFTLYNFPFVHR
jgi:hypothetical protein